MVDEARSERSTAPSTDLILRRIDARLSAAQAEMAALEAARDALVGAPRPPRRARGRGGSGSASAISGIDLGGLAGAGAVDSALSGDPGGDGPPKNPKPSRRPLECD
jgi:hypothetical protein